MIKTDELMSELELRELFSHDEDDWDSPLENRIQVCDGEWIKEKTGSYFEVWRFWIYE